MNTIYMLALCYLFPGATAWECHDSLNTPGYSMVYYQSRAECLGAAAMMNSQQHTLDRQRFECFARDTWRPVR